MKYEFKPVQTGNKEKEKRFEVFDSTGKKCGSICLTNIKEDFAADLDFICLDENEAEICREFYKYLANEKMFEILFYTTSDEDSADHYCFSLGFVIEEIDNSGWEPRYFLSKSLSGLE